MWVIVRGALMLIHHGTPYEVPRPWPERIIRTPITRTCR